MSTATWIDCTKCDKKETCKKYQTEILLSSDGICIKGCK